MIKTNVTQANRQAHGLCVMCGKEDERTRNGNTRCAACAKKHAQTIRERTEALRKMGRCTVCGKNKEDDGWSLCPACRERSREQTRKYRAAHEKKKA